MLAWQVITIPTGSPSAERLEYNGSHCTADHHRRAFWQRRPFFGFGRQRAHAQDTVVPTLIDRHSPIYRD